MEDRAPLYPGRVQLNPVAGQANVYDMVRKDQPQREGTPLNKNALLKDSTASALGLASTAVPDDALVKLNANINNTRSTLQSQITSLTSKTVPSGTIVLWSGSTSNIPSGWVLCNGSNGTPDLRNRFVVGAGSNYSVGATGGAESVALEISEMPSHAHSSFVPGSSWGVQGPDGPGSGGGMTGSAGGGQAHENRPPYYALCYIMKK